MPEFIAAVMPSTRSSRSASATSASPKTFVYCGGCAAVRGAWRGASASAAGAPLTIDAGLAACHFSMPSRPPSSAGAKPLPLTVAAVDDDRAVGLERLADRLAQRADVVAVDHADVGEVELLEEQARAPSRP